MWSAWAEFDLPLGDVHSVKAKRSIIRPLVTEKTEGQPRSSTTRRLCKGTSENTTTKSSTSTATLQ